MLDRQASQKSRRRATARGIAGKPAVQLIDRRHRLQRELAPVLTLGLAGHADEQAQDLRLGGFRHRHHLEQIRERSITLAQRPPGLGGDLRQQPQAA